MTTGLQLAIAAGGLFALGVTLLVWRLVPAEPDLADAIRRLSADHTTVPTTTSTPVLRGRERIGGWVLRTLPVLVVSQPRPADLAILRISLARFYGEKVLFTLVGLCLPALLAGILAVGGLHLPVAIPAVVSLMLAAGLFFMPDYNVRDDARRARREFGRALGAYIDLVALERLSGSGIRQAMEVAATVGDTWVFRRLGEELARSRWNGVAPWEALHTLAGQLGVTELDDVADILRLSGEEGAAVAEQLRARSASLRSAQLHHDLGKANEVNERLSIPMSMLGVTFLALLVAPPLLRLFWGAP